jgi:hypothetical protein
MTGKDAYANALAQIREAVDAVDPQDTAVARFWVFGDGRAGPTFNLLQGYDSVSGIETKVCALCSIFSSGLFGREDFALISFLFQHTGTLQMSFV